MVDSANIHTLTATLRGHQSIVKDVKVTVDGKKIISGSDDRTIKVWNIETGECLLTLEGHQSHVESLAVTADKIISGSNDGTIKVWSLETGVCLSTLEGHQSHVSSVAVTADDTRIISGSHDWTVKVWNISIGACLSTLQGHKHFVTSIAVTRDAEKIVSCSVDMTLKVWRLPTGECMFTLRGHQGAILSVTFTADGKKIISGSDDHTVKVWSMTTGNCLSTIKAHQGGVLSVSNTVDGKKIITCSQDKTVKVWNISTRECLSTLEGHLTWVLGVAITADGEKVVSCSADKTVKVWSIAGLSDSKTHTTKTDEATALNDNAKGIDRFQFLAYAKALHFMLHSASPPICIGLFAKWGSGKSFMMHLLKQEFDPKCEEDPNTFEIIQSFDTRFIGKQLNEMEPQDSCLARCSIRFKILSKWLGTDSSSLSSLTLAWYLLMRELFEELLQDLRSFYFGGYRPLSNLNSLSPYHFEDEMTSSHHFPMLLCRCGPRSVSPEIDSQDEEKAVEMNADPTAKEKMKKGYIFVDFNAWEFNKSDQLWVGLIRNIYRKVEQRLQAYRDDKGNAVDYKRIWRAEKAKEVVIQSYGGIRTLRLRILLLFFCCFILLVCLILALCFLRELIHFFRSHQSGGVVSLLSFLGFFGGTLYPILEMLFRTGKATNTSQGERIYNEASDGREKLGFLHQVREELDQLFKFLGDTYQKETGESLTLVIFIDDLDRCVGQGRIVAVLEALQLLLNIPGAPVIAFLAADSRIIASSIEMTLNQNVDLQDTSITGWEYLDKIIQVPFCLPPPSPQKVQRMLTSSLAGKDISLSVVAQRLRDFINELQDRLETFKSKSRYLISFLEEDKSKQCQSHQVSIFLSYLIPFKDHDENLVCIAATSVLSHYAANVEMRSRGLEKKERLEVICQSVNFCLYHFDFFKEEQGDLYELQNEILTRDGEVTPLRNHESPNLLEEKQVTGEEAEVRVPSDVDMELQELKSILFHISASSLPPLVQPEVLTALNEISMYLDPNPRKLKRIANILQLVTAVAKYKSISDTNQDQQYLSMNPRWGDFSLKVVKWIGLCECYPFRTSLLAQLLEDLDQKQTYGVRNPKGLLQYEGVNEVEFENMDLVEFYYKFVVPLMIHHSAEFKRLNRLDTNPEQFVSYLSLKLSHLLGKGKGDILASDVLGPLVDEEKRLRDPNFSLLSHSFNLNPDLRSIIALELQQIKRPTYPLILRKDSGERIVDDLNANW
jgi:hypothetical protein